MNRKDPKVLVIASAGGHLTQAMCAVADIDNIYLVSNKKNITSDSIVESFKIIDTQTNIFIHFINFFFAIYVLLKVKPKSIFSTGGPIVLPFVVLCRLIGKKVVFLDTLSRVNELSNTGKFIHRNRLVTKMFVQWRRMSLQHQIPYIGKTFDILNTKDYIYETLPVPEKPIIFVTVGTNQYDFDRLFTMLSKLTLYHSDKVEWIIQAAHNKLKVAPKSGKVVSLVSRDEMQSYVQNASVVISHCGIGSINLMLSYQKRVFFIPRLSKYKEFSDDHQLQIANEIGNDLFTIIHESEVLPDLTLDLITSYPLLKHPVDTTNYKVAKDIKNELLGN